MQSGAHRGWEGAQHHNQREGGGSFNQTLLHHVWFRSVPEVPAGTCGPTTQRPEDKTEVVFKTVTAVQPCDCYRTSLEFYCEGLNSILFPQR